MFVQIFSTLFADTLQTVGIFVYLHHILFIFTDMELLELMIGDYVKNKQGNVIVIQEILFENNQYYALCHFESGVNKFPISDLTGIGITHDILVNNGFLRNSIKGNIRYDLPSLNSSTYFVVHVSDGYCIGMEDGGDHRRVTRDAFLYVHNLQNIFRTIFKREIELKETTL